MNTLLALRRITSRRRLAAALAALVVAGCGGGDPEPAVPQASATIGAAGGTLDGPDGVKVEIPAGALTQDTVIRVAKTSVGAPTTAPEGYPPRSIYEFTPHGIEFKRPVTISLPTPAGDPSQQQVFMASPGDAGWRGVASVAAGGRTAWEVLGFSWGFGGDACFIPSNNTDPFLCAPVLSFATLQAAPSSALALITNATTVPRYTLTAEATVSVVFRFSAARDCSAAEVKVSRWRPDIVDGNGRIVRTTLRDLQNVPLTPSPDSTERSEGQISVPLPFTAADNGTNFFGMSFSCLRPGRTVRTAYGGQISLDVSGLVAAPPSAPLITSQPAAQAVQAPATATFSVTAAGSPAPTVQWQRSVDGGNTWTDVAGANAPSYTTPATAPATDNGSQFRAVLTNSQGSTTSQAALLTVTSPTTVATASVFAGSLTAAGSVDGNGGAARLDAPTNIALDAAGNAYFIDACTLRKLTPTGNVSTLAGTYPVTGLCTFADGTGAAARFHYPFGLAVDSQGNVFVAETFGAIRKVTPAGVVTTFAGSDMGQGFADGQGSAALFSNPYGLAVDASDNLYVADAGNDAVRKIDPAGNVTTVASGRATDAQGNAIPAIDGPVGTATFVQPRALAFDANGVLYVAEIGVIRRIAGGIVSTVVGRLSGSEAYADGSGPNAGFGVISQIALDGNDTMYVADRTNNTVRKVDLVTRQVSTVLGVKTSTTTNPGATPPTVYAPYGVAVTAPGQALVSSGSHVILRATLP